MDKAQLLRRDMVAELGTQGTHAGSGMPPELDHHYLLIGFEALPPCRTINGAADVDHTHDPPERWKRDAAPGLRRLAGL
jgi:hypothetical protein